MHKHMLRLSAAAILACQILPGVPSAFCDSAAWGRIADYHYRAAKAGGIGAGAARGYAQGMRRRPAGGGCATMPAGPPLSANGRFYWDRVAQRWLPVSDRPQERR